MYVGTRYILRAQERIRRKEAGLPVDDDDLESFSSETVPRRRMERILGLDFGTSNVRLAHLPLDSRATAAMVTSADGYRSIPAAVSVDNGTVTVGHLAKACLGRKTGATALGVQMLLGRSPQVCWLEEH